jgi:hypothetical protein
MVTHRVEGKSSTLAQHHMTDDPAQEKRPGQGRRRIFKIPHYRLIEKE